MSTALLQARLELLMEAAQLRRSLDAAGDEMARQIERLKRAGKAVTTAKRVYKEKESDFFFELAYETEEYNRQPKAKLPVSEVRELIKDKALIEARNNGTLRTAWSAVLDAEDEQADANADFDKAESRLKDLRALVALQTKLIHSVCDNE